MIAQEQIDEVKTLCRAVSEIIQGGQPFLFIEGLKLPPACQSVEVNALLALHPRDGYASRLYLSAPMPQRGANWSTVCLLDRTWHTWSWQNVSVQQRPVQVLAGHIQGLR